MYELPGPDVGYTHEDVHQARLAADLEEPHIIGDLDLSEASTVTGGHLGLSGPPPQDWRRLLWHDLSERLGLKLGESEFPPCFRWFPYRSWPASIDPPPEGSLDAASLTALLSILTEFTSTAECIAAYGLVAAGASDEIQRCFRGPLPSLPGLVNREEWRIGTPSNFWPDDRSWFVYTDWDLWGTKVSGSSELIEAVAEHAGLETLAWERPAR